MCKRVVTILLLCTICMFSTLFLQSAPAAHAASSHASRASKSADTPPICGPDVPTGYAGTNCTPPSGPANGTGAPPPPECTLNQTCQGCDPGYVCIYNGSTPTGAPIYRFYSYRVYPISNMYGQHAIVNNQIGGAWAELCTDKSCSNPAWLISPLTEGVYDLTPINYVNVKPNA